MITDNDKISYQEEIKILLDILPDEVKIKLANIPKVQTLDANGPACSIGALIRKERNLWVRCKNNHAETTSFFILMDLWEELQKHSEYLGELRDYYTGEPIPEMYRQPTPESIERFVFPKRGCQ